MIFYLAFCFLDRYSRSYQVHSRVACPRLSDSGENAKEKGARKVGEAGKSFLPFYFRVCAFSIQRTISEPGTG